MKFKSLLLCMCVGIIVTASPAAAVDKAKRNFSWWSNLSNSEQLSYCIGYIDGMEEARGLLLAAKSISDMKNTPDWLPKNFDFRGMTNQQIQEGVNEFYKDYRNKSVDASDVLGYVRMAIQGATKEDLEREAISLRKAAAMNAAEQ